MKRQHQLIPRRDLLPGAWVAIFLLASGLCSARVEERDFNRVASNGGGFLSDKLPLAVVVTTPSKLADESTERLRVEGQQALTVVYSRSVIALGQDFGTTQLPDDKIPFFLEPEVPGRFRWVTTYIARWDPDGTWPLDSDIKFTFNQNLKTHDGIPLQQDGRAGSIILSTPSLSMFIQGITSEKAFNLTDGNWNADSGLDSDVLPEVPPDGVIRLKFNTKVSLTALQQNLKVVPRSLGEPDKGWQVNVQQCAADFNDHFSPAPCLKCKAAASSGRSEEEHNCAAMTIDGDLDVAASYGLMLSEGTRYSTNNGLLRRALIVGIGGLRKFKIPFFEKSYGSGWQFSTNFFRLWLPHGLQEPQGSGIQALKNQISIVDAHGEKVAFQLELKNKATLRMLTSLIPKMIYTVQVEASNDILDGFGLPLESSSFQFSTQLIRARVAPFRTYNSYMIFEAREDWGRKVVAAFTGNTAQSCMGPHSVNVYPVLGSQEVKAIPLYIQGSTGRGLPLSQYLSDPVGTLQQSQQGVTELVEFGIKEHLNPTGIVAADGGACKPYKEWNILINESDMQALILGSEAGPAIVWVASMKTGEPVEGATVTLGDFTDEQDLPRSLASSETNAAGKAVFRGGLSTSEFAHVEHQGKSLFVRKIDSGYKSLTKKSFSLVLDKKLVKPGDTLHIKGYCKGQKLKEAAIITVYPPFDPDSKGNLVFPVEIDDRFETFEVEVPVPANATNSGYSISFHSGKASLQWERFTVGNPRPPTVGLTINAPFWAKPDLKVKVDVVAESFIGAAVGDAEITLKWSIPGVGRLLEGESKLTTDSLGKASTDIDLGLLEKTPSANSHLDIDVSWVGPTRELIRESASVLLRTANVEIDIARTVETDVPGQAFGVKMALIDLKGMPLKSKRLAMQLKKLTSSDDVDNLPTTSVQPLHKPVIQSCMLQPNSHHFDCRFTIPDLGQFVLEVCVGLEPGSAQEPFCRIIKLGKTAEKWEAIGKLADHLQVELVTMTDGPHKVGDRLTFGIENPYQNAKALIMWGSHLGVNHAVISITDNALHEFSIDLGENCRQGCGLDVGVMVPRQTGGVAMNPKGVPIAKLFDLAMPHATHLTHQIEVTTDVPLDVGIAFPNVTEDEAQEFVIAPRETTTIRVDVRDSGIDEAEVTVIAVDKAILQLVPYALKDVTAALAPHYRFWFGFSSTHDDLVSPHAIETLIRYFWDTKKIDPWFDPLVKLAANRYSFLDKSLQAYIDHRSRVITVGGRPTVAYSTSASTTTRSAPLSHSPAAHSASVPFGKAAPLPKSSVRVLEDFVSTALFKTVVAKDGIATVDFTGPDNLGTFNIRAYVATEDKQYGSAEKEIIVRRSISLTPSAPRFVRVGDVFEAGSVITLSGANPMTAQVLIGVSLLGADTIEIIGDSKRVVRVGDDSTEEVRFRFRAKQMGEAKFNIFATVDRMANDALTINFPVEGVQEAVTLVSSFAINGASTGWQEGLRLPWAIPGSGAIRIQAGVGRLPAVLSTAGQIYESNPNHQCPISADFALAAVTIPFATETYKVLDLPPATLDPVTLDIVNGIRSNFTAGVASLQEMTRGGIGLDYFSSCKKSPRTFPKQPSFTTNARGVFLLSLLKDDVEAAERVAIRKGAQRLKSLELNWISSLESAVIVEALASRKHEQAMSIARVAFARAALGGDWVAPPRSSDEIVEDLSMERLSKEFDSMGTESQAYYAVARISMGGGEAHPDIQKAVKSWMSNFRVTGRTAYIAHSKGAAAPASNAANSLALMVMVRAKVENPLLEKLANYVSSPPVSQYGFRVFSNYEKSLAMLALRDYDVDRGSNQPELKLEVNSGDFALLDVEFIGNTNPVASSSTPWESLASPPDPLEFRASGTGEVTLAAALTFVPAQLLPFPTYRGIFVQRSISIAESEETNKASSLTTVPVTSVVEVSIQLTTPDRLGPTTVRVLVPAGLEPLDPNISGGSTTGGRLYCPIPFASLFRSHFFSCPDQETEASVVTFRYKSVNAGTQTVSFRAVAATAGTFALPPVKAFVDDQPEVMGLSSSGELEVCSGVGCAAEHGAPPNTPKSCPKDCSGTGACDLDTGSCLCFHGFTGSDCGELVSAPGVH